MSVLRRRAVVLLLLLLALAACTNDHPGPGPTLRRQASSENVPGHLLSERRIDGPKGTRAWRVLYTSRSLDGDPVRVSGVVVAPKTPAPAGGYPIVSWAHGIVGLADHCAPSRQRPLIGSSVPALHLGKLGMVIAASDYEGLGTPGPHPTAVGVSEGRSVLDIARAVREMPQLDTRNQVLAFGHSEGGQGALFAGQLASTYAPDLHLMGVIASAPAAELPMLTRAFPTAGLIGSLVMAAVAYHDTYPGLSLERVLTPWAISQVPAVRSECAAEVLQRFDVPETQVFRSSAFSMPPWPSLLARNTPGAVPIPAPALIVQGVDDPTAPLQSVQALGQRLCDRGDVVEYREYPGVGHEPIARAAPDIFGWAQARLLGAPPPSSCGDPALT
ncbi:MAG: lipase family protein [Actinomycetota bacterium]